MGSASVKAASRTRLGRAGLGGLALAERSRRCIACGAYSCWRKEGPVAFDKRLEDEENEVRNHVLD